MAHGRKKAPAGYRWKTVTKLNALGRGYTTHVLVPLDEKALEKSFKDAELESYKAFTPYPGQATDQYRDLPKTEAKSTSWLDQFLAPIKDVPRLAEEDRLAGIETIKEAKTPYGQALGAFQWGVSPISGAWSALWDKPVSGNLQNLGMDKKTADNVALYTGIAVPFAGQVKNLANTPRAVNAIVKKMRTTADGRQAVTDLKDGVNGALTHTKVEDVLHAATTPTKIKPTVRPAAVADDTAGLARVADEVAPVTARVKPTPTTRASVADEGLVGRQREYVPGADFAEDAAVATRPTPPRNLADQARRSDDVLTRAEANAAIARINTMEASGLEASAASRMRVAVESKVAKPPVSLADETAGLPIRTPVRPTVTAGETSMPTVPSAGAGSRVVPPKPTTGDAAAATRAETARLRAEAARRAAERDAAARASATVGPPKPPPFVGPPSPASTVLGPPKKLYTDSASRAAVARRADLSKQILAGGVAVPVIAGTVYQANQERLAALEKEREDREQLPGMGAGRGPDLPDPSGRIPAPVDARMGGGPQDRAEAYAAQVGGQPRTNNIGGQPATEEQMSWAEKYYGAKFARDPAARYKKNKEFKQSLWKKMAILNAIAALTGNTSQAEQYATYALGMHEDAMQFDDDMRMHKMHKAVYFRPDGTFDPPKNSEAAYNRAIQIGASPDEAKEVYGFTPKKTAKQMFWRSGDDGKPEIKYFEKGTQPEDDGKGIWRTDAVDDPTQQTLSSTGKRIAERDGLIALKDAAINSGDMVKAEAIQRNIDAYDRDFDPNSSPSVRATRIWNVYRDLHKGMGGNLLPKDQRKSFEDWVKDESEGGGAMWARMHGLSSGQIMEGMGQSDNIVRISTQEEYNELPIGTIYIDSGGQPKKKTAESK